MPRPNIQDASWRILSDDTNVGRFAPLQVDVVDAETGEPLLQSGGRWDRRERRYDGFADECRRLFAHGGQREAVRWFAGWLPHYVARAQVLDARGAGQQVDDYETPAEYARKWNLVLVGGAGAGKSYLCLVFLVAVAVALPRGVIWAVAPTDERTTELREVLDAFLPSQFCVWSERRQEWRFHNGTVIRLLSASRPARLKQGRVDLVLLNEPQEMSKAAHNMARRRIGDRGGIVLMAANPPSQPVGQWVFDLYQAHKAGKKSHTVLFELDPHDNPSIDHDALDDMEEDLGRDDFLREATGAFIPIGDRVLWAWVPAVHEREVPDLGYEDITREVTRRQLGRAFDWVGGADFQLDPHQAAPLGKVYRELATGEEILWWLAEVVEEKATEDELVDGLEALGYHQDPKRDDGKFVGLVADATGDYQGSERKKGKTSWGVFRSRTWRFLYEPQKGLKRKNPDVTERIRTANGRIQNKRGRVRVYASPTGCPQLCAAFLKWPTRHGKPVKESDHAHLGDAATYVIMRLWPRRVKRKGPGVEVVTRPRGAFEQELDDLF